MLPRMKQTISWSSVRDLPLFFLRSRVSDVFKIIFNYLEFADVLNHLENEFYTEALSQFQESDFEEAGFSNSQLATQILQSIAGDEANHFGFIEVRSHFLQMFIYYNNSPHGFVANRVP
jgi:hypothetical protein